MSSSLKPELIKGSERKPCSDWQSLEKPPSVGWWVDRQACSCPPCYFFRLRNLIDQGVLPLSVSAPLVELINVGLMRLNFEHPNHKSIFTDQDKDYALSAYCRLRCRLACEEFPRQLLQILLESSQRAVLKPLTPEDPEYDRKELEYHLKRAMKMKVDPEYRAVEGGSSPSDHVLKLDDINQSGNASWFVAPDLVLGHERSPDQMQNSMGPSGGTNFVAAGCRSQSLSGFSQGLPEPSDCPPRYGEQTNATKGPIRVRKRRSRVRNFNNQRDYVRENNDGANGEISWTRQDESAQAKSEAFETLQTVMDSYHSRTACSTVKNHGISKSSTSQTPTTHQTSRSLANIALSPTNGSLLLPKSARRRHRQRQRRRTSNHRNIPTRPTTVR